jgi:hypothetical protein
MVAGLAGFGNGVRSFELYWRDLCVSFYGEFERENCD